MRRYFEIGFVPVAVSTAGVAASSFTVGKLPSLGWNSWNAVHCDVDESVVLNAASSFIASGLKDVGYEFVNIDDCWSVKDGRDSQGRIQPDLAKFPDGIDGLASKVHGMGLKLGIYSDAGSMTCAGYPGSLGNETVDATTFSEWGIDYLKYDNCNIPSNWTDDSSYTDWSQSKSAQRYRQMSDAIASLPNNGILFNLCIWGTANITTWGSELGQSWRISGDVEPSWKSIVSIIDQNVKILDAVDFYAHNDMDMMEIGNGNLTIQEQRTHFAIWAALKSPILLGTDLSKLSTDQLDIIKNKELLAFSQDSAIGKPAKPLVLDSGDTTSPPEFYAGQSSLGTHVFVINLDDASTNKSFRFDQVPGLLTTSPNDTDTGNCSKFLVHDMWTGKDMGTFKDEFSASLEAHDTGAWRITCDRDATADVTSSSQQPSKPTATTRMNVPSSSIRSNIRHSWTYFACLIVIGMIL